MLTSDMAINLLLNIRRELESETIKAVILAVVAYDVVDSPTIETMER